MKTYNFDEIIPRHGSDSYKWDSTTNQDVLPMWVADMDFRTAPPIIEELQQRVSHGIFGYTRVPDAYYNAVTNWFSRRHNWQIDKNWIIYTSGVVPAISAIIKALTKTGDKVIVQTPVYNCFFSSIRNNDCEILCNRLIYEHNTYRIDYEDLEQKASDPKARILLLCNPHNPAGRVWTINELKRIGEICIRHGIIVVSDEIHCELVYPGHRYIPFASISEDFLHQSVTCLSPSKSFNIAGLHINRRNGYIPEGFNGKISKSCHSVDELSNIDMYEYVFLSPIYDSICKQGYTSRFTTAELQEAHKTGAINSKVIALGGMTASRICEIKDFGFGGAAFLGYLFESENDKRLKDKLKTIINSI